jgi:WD40 repeat protein
MSLWKQSPADLRFEMLFTCRFIHTISCVLLCPTKDRGFALCGLNDGSVGYHPIKSESVINNNGATLPMLKHTAGVVALASDDEEGWIISASKDTSVMVYESRRQMIVSDVHNSSPTATMRYCQEQKRLLCGLTNGRVAVWDTSHMPMQQVANIPDGADGVQSTAKISGLDYDALTRTLFTASTEGFRLWGLKNTSQGAWARCTGQLPPAASAPTAVTWAPSSREILAGFSTGAVAIFDLDSSEASFAFQAHTDSVDAMLWLDAPRRLLTASKDKTLKIWDFPSLERMPLEDHPSFSVPTPAISTAASRMPGGGGSGGGGYGQRASNPALGSSGVDPLIDSLRGGAPVSAGSPDQYNASTAASYSGADPLAGGPRRTSAPPGYSSRTDGLGPLGAPNPLGTGGSGPPAPQRPQVAGSKPSGIQRADSDDDLAGWDT